MKNLFLGTIIVLFFAHCSSQQNSENILTRARMVSILTDIHILEVKIDGLAIKKRDSARKIFNTYQQELFEKHGTTKQEYEESFSYYTERPKELEAIYAIVVDSLNLREQKINMIVAKEEELRELAEAAREDSILRVDSIKQLADTLGLLFDSLVFWGDSLGYTLDSLASIDSLKAKVDSLIVTTSDTTAFEEQEEVDSDLEEPEKTKNKD